VSDDVMTAAGPHRASSTAAVLDPVTRTLIETARFAGTDEGYGQLARLARRWQDRRWAVEGCHGAGRPLAQRLVADGEVVLDVPAKLAARVRAGHGLRHRPGHPAGESRIVQRPGDDLLAMLLKTSAGASTQSTLIS
jgi:hypothetical protein